MDRSKAQKRFRYCLSAFWRAQDGVATVDWVMLMGAATGTAIMALNLGQDNLRGYTGEVRDELQAPYFNTSWTENVEIPPREEWDDRPPITPRDPEGSSGGDVGTPDPNGNGNTNPDPDPGNDPDPNPDSGNDPDPDPNPNPDPDPGSGQGSGTPNIPSGRVVGCPTTDYQGPPHDKTGPQLTGSGFSVAALAGGATQIQWCQGIPGVGYFSANPNFSLTLTELDALFQLQIETTGPHCDTTLLVRMPNGGWYFDDDAGDRLRSRLRFTAIDFNMSDLNGRMDVWVGTYNGNDCNVGVEVKTSY